MRAFLQTAFAISLVSFTLPGCGSSTAKTDDLRQVTGTVTYDGMPLTSGFVTFMPAGETGNSATGDLDSSGGYSLSTRSPRDGVQPGSYKVAVTSWEISPEMGQEGVSAIPKKYFDANKSGLTATVTDESDQTIDFEIKSE